MGICNDCGVCQCQVSRLLRIPRLFLMYPYRHSDKTGEKFFHIIGPEIFGIIGFAIAFATQKLAARYVALFLMAQSYAGFIVFYSWIR
jgi:hypothetical protein